MREGHVFRADLDGEKIVAKSREWSGGQNEEDHDGGMHGHQLEIIFRSHDAARSTVRRNRLESRNGGIGPAEVDAHQPGKHHAGDDRDESERVVLQTDDLVVEAEDVLR